MSKVNELADIIRKHGKISFESLCTEGHIAPSTLYAYKKLILEKCGDITFKDGFFKVVPVEK